MKRMPRGALVRQVQQPGRRVSRLKKKHAVEAWFAQRVGQHGAPGLADPQRLMLSAAAATPCGGDDANAHEQSGGRGLGNHGKLDVDLV